MSQAGESVLGGWEDAVEVELPPDGGHLISGEKGVRHAKDTTAVPR